MESLLKEIRQKSENICSDYSEDLKKFTSNELQLRNDFINCLKQNSEEHKTRVKNVNSSYITKVKQKRNELKTECNAKLLQEFEEQKIKEKGYEESVIVLCENMCSSAMNEFEKHLKSAVSVHYSGQTTGTSNADLTFPDSENYTIKEGIKDRIRKELMDTICEIVERMRRRDKGFANLIYEKDSIERDELSKEFNRKLFEFLDSFENSLRFRRTDKEKEQKRQVRENCTNSVKQCFERLKKRRGELQAKLAKGDDSSTTKITVVKRKYGELMNAFQKNLVESEIKERREFDEELNNGQEGYFKKINALFVLLTDDRTTQMSDRRVETNKYLREIFDLFKKKENEFRANTEVKQNEINTKYRTAFVSEAKKQINNFVNSLKGEKMNVNKASPHSRHSTRRESEKPRPQNKSVRTRKHKTNKRRK